MTLNELFARFDKLAAVSHSGPGPEGGLVWAIEGPVVKPLLTPRVGTCQDVPCWRNLLLGTSDGQRDCSGSGFDLTCKVSPDITQLEVLCWP